MVYYEIVLKQERHQSVTPTADIKANTSNTKFTKKFLKTRSIRNTLIYKKGRFILDIFNTS